MNAPGAWGTVAGRPTQGCGFSALRLSPSKMLFACSSCPEPKGSAERIRSDMSRSHAAQRRLSCLAAQCRAAQSLDPLAALRHKAARAAFCPTRPAGGRRALQAPAGPVSLARRPAAPQSGAAGRRCGVGRAAPLTEAFPKGASERGRGWNVGSGRGTGGLGTRARGGAPQLKNLILNVII